MTDTSYQAACEQAIIDQHLGEVEAMLKDKGWVFETEQTGGFTMVTAVPVPAGVVGITADSETTYLACFYPGQAWYLGDVEHDVTEGLTLEALATHVQTYVDGYRPEA